MTKVYSIENGEIAYNQKEARIIAFNYFCQHPDCKEMTFAYCNGKDRDCVAYMVNCNLYVRRA